MRASGILLPISGIPSAYGIGTFSKEAYDFVDFWRRQARLFGRSCLLGLPDMEIRPISPFQRLREILIILIWKS